MVGVGVSVVVVVDCRLLACKAAKTQIRELWSFGQVNRIERMRIIEPAKKTEDVVEGKSG